MLFPRIFVFLFAWTFFALPLCSQNIDSLKTALKTAGDRDKADILRELALAVQYDNPDQCLKYAQESIALARKTNYKWCEAYCLRIIGIYYDEHGDYKKAISNIEEALAINRAIPDAGGISACLNSLGIIYFNLSKYDLALKNFLEVLPHYDEKTQASSKAYTLMNIGGVYNYSGNKKAAIDYYSQSYRLCKKIGDTRGAGICANNIGMAYHAISNKDSAIHYLDEGLAVKRKLNDKKSLAASLSNLSNVYLDYQEYPQAITYLEECISLQKEIGDKRGLANSLNSAGQIMAKSDNKKEKAIDYFLESYKISSEVGDLPAMRSSSFNIGNEYYNMGKYKEAADFIYVNSRIRDSLFNYDRSKTLAEMQTKYETEKKESEIVLLGQKNRLSALELEKAHADQLRKEQALALLNKEAEMKAIQLQKAEAESESNRKQNELLKLDQQVKTVQLQKEQAERGKLDEQNKKRAQQLFAVLIGSLLLLVLLAVAFRGYRQKKKANVQLAEQNTVISRQKEEVQHQRDIVEEKNKEITDSITYAKRLQDAILPPEKLWRSFLPESFVLYKPKDIVAGDFYWMEGKGDLLLFAAADCTGHGVPGAMVSVVCSNALNRTVNEFGITEPGKILDKVRELVIETFAKSESEVKDGMDISLCCYNKEKSQVLWAGANNPLWIIRKDGTVVEELSPDKQPIGQFDSARPFRTQEVSVQPGDCLYLLTDGFPDQFGGPKGKKFKYRPLQELLLSNCRKPMNEQLDLLNRSFESWRGSLDQVDDVCLIGVRIV